MTFLSLIRLTCQRSVRRSSYGGTRTSCYQSPPPTQRSCFHDTLRGWFLEMVERFPALNGPHACSRDQRSADYSNYYHLIPMAVWSDEEAAHRRAHELAGKHGLGLIEASSPDGEIWLPGVGGELVLASNGRIAWPARQNACRPTTGTA